MDSDFSKRPHSDVTEKIISVFYSVYNELGYGFLESVYQRAMHIALREAGLNAKREVEISVGFRGHEVGLFRCDLLVEDAVLLELKAVDRLESTHEAQVLNYLRGTTIEIALLLNFGKHPQVRRLAFSNDRKISVHQRSSAAEAGGL